VGKDKLRRFAIVENYSHFIQPELGEECEFKGKWRSHYFKNDNPIVVELGCGKGEYTVGLAERNQNINYIGVDIKGARMYIGAKDSLEKGLKNVAFLRTKVDFITKSFELQEVDEIWLTFSDPQRKKPNKRLTSKVFIERYRQILKPGGFVHLKTDSDILFEYTEQEIDMNNYPREIVSWNIYNDLEKLKSDDDKEILQIRTHYEKLFSAKGSTIKYAKFKIS
jgi:tRNA (guanine-N7-)-methyltransferase